MMKIFENNDIRLASFLFLSLFTIYFFSVGFQLYSSDTYMNLAVADNLLKRGTMNIAGLPYAVKFGYCAENQTSCVNPTPLGTMLSFWPFIFAENIYSGKGQLSMVDEIEDRFKFIDALYGPSLIAGTVAILFLLMRDLKVSAKNAFLATIIFALGTIAWAYARTTFNVNLTTFFLTLAIFSINRGFSNKSAIWFLLGGAATGFLILLRTDTILILPVVSVYVAWHLWKIRSIKFGIMFFLPLFVFGFIFFAFNQFAYGSFFNLGYTKHDGDFSIWRIPYGIYGLLFSPGAGLFAFSPVCLLFFITAYDSFKKYGLLTLMFFGVILSQLLFFGSFVHWHGWLTWGPRYLLILIPLFAITLGISLDSRSSNRYFMAMLILLTLAGFFTNTLSLINWVASYNYPGGMHTFKQPGEFIPSKSIYDPAYSQIVFHIRILQGKEMVGYDMSDLRIYTVFGNLAVALFLAIEILVFLWLKPVSVLLKKQLPF